MENWLSGYLSGLNVAHTKGGIVPSDPLSELNSMDQARIWMDNYCRADPLSKISGAAVQLFSELIAKRRQ